MASELGVESTAKQGAFMSLQPMMGHTQQGLLHPNMCLQTLPNCMQIVCAYHDEGITEDTFNGLIMWKYIGTGVADRVSTHAATIRGLDM